MSDFIVMQWIKFPRTFTTDCVDLVISRSIVCLWHTTDAAWLFSWLITATKVVWELKGFILSLTDEVLQTDTVFVLSLGGKTSQISLIFSNNSEVL